MAARAYILIEARVGAAQDVLAALRRLDSIPESDIITGNYDLIALVEAEDIVALVAVVTGQVQTISGVERTITCVAA